MTYRLNNIVGVVFLALAGCSDDGGAAADGEDETTTSSGDSTSTGGTTEPTVTVTMSTSSTSTSVGPTTDPSTESSSDSSDGSSDSSTSGDSSSSSGDSSSSSTTGDVDIVCEGPPGDATCEVASPYTGPGECDPYAQDCPDGDKCMPWANDGGNAWNSTRCSPLDPNPAALGEACAVEGSGVSGVDDCDLGLMCWDVDPETNMGECIELCGCGPAEPTCSGGGTICVNGSNEGALPICLPTCDPLDLDECPDGQGCYSTDDNFLCVPDASAGGGDVGDPCAFANSCTAGLICLNGAVIPGCAASACCGEVCDTDQGDSQCTLAGTECENWYDAGTEPEECHEDTGICIVPQN